jgi:hypothetical protein
MIRDTAACRDNHERFLDRVVKSETVWGLRGPSGFADCDSNDSDSVVLMFWSDRGYAARVRQQSFAAPVSRADESNDCRDVREFQRRRVGTDALI